MCLLFNNGHIGMDHFVHYREVVLFQRYPQHNVNTEIASIQYPVYA